MTNTHRIKYFLFQRFFFSNKGRLVLIWGSVRTILPIFKDGVYWKIYRGFHEQVEPKKLERKRGGWAREEQDGCDNQLLQDFSLPNPLTTPRCIKGHIHCL